ERWAAFQKAASLLAWSAQKQGKPDEARDALARVVVVEPDFQPPHSDYPPTLGLLAKEAASALHSKPQGSLTVTSQPAGLPVYVDGRPEGKSPVLLDLPRGDHRVEVAFPGRRGVPRDVHLEEAASVE